MGGPLRTQYAAWLFDLARRKRVVAWDEHQRGTFYVSCWFMAGLNDKPTQGPFLLFGFRAVESPELQDDALVYVC